MDDYSMPCNPSRVPLPSKFKVSAVPEYHNNCSSIESCKAPCHAQKFLGANSLPTYPAYTSPNLDIWKREINVPSNLVVLETNPRNPTESQSQPINYVPQSLQVADRKKRKEATNADEHKIETLCKCRRSRCLKLYCECFAAGLFCGDSCLCEGCFNSSDYEDIVYQTREQIESRDHLAFAPKVVTTVDSPSAFMECGNSVILSSARHKRGCNCKKSMCLKKYCDCFQAEVGCSDVCRCEDCKNVYGIKGGHGSAERRNMSPKEKILDSMQGMPNDIEIGADDQFPPWGAIMNASDDYLTSDPETYLNSEMSDNIDFIQAVGDEGFIPQSSVPHCLPPSSKGMAPLDESQALPGLKPESYMPHDKWYGRS